MLARSPGIGSYSVHSGTAMFLWRASHHCFFCFCLFGLCVCVFLSLFQTVVHEEVKEVAIFHLADGSMRGIPQRLTWEKDPPHTYTHTKASTS